MTVRTAKRHDVLQRVAGFIERRSLRERAIIACTVFTLLLVGFGQVIWVPQTRSLLEANRQIESIEASLPARKGALSELKRRAEMDPDDELRSQLATLEKSLLLQEKAYFEQLDYLVTPSQMVSVLYDVLGAADGISLITLENLPAEPLRLSDDENADARAGFDGGDHALYRHAVRVEFEADYFNTVSYLQRLEQVGERLIFRSMHYEVVNYPKARVTVVVETLGMDTEWLGV